MPPSRAWAGPDNSRILVDGFTRWLAMRTAGIDKMPALVWHGNLEEAIVQGLISNRRPDGKLHCGPNAERALCVLAAVLDRTVARHEAESIGIEWTEHSIPTPDVLRVLRLPAALELALERHKRTSTCPRPAANGRRPKSDSRA